MPRVRRSAYVFLHARDGRFVDVPLLLRGRVELAPLPQLSALSVVTGQAHVLSKDELRAFLEVPSSEWTDAAAVRGATAEALASLVEQGLVLSDPADDRGAEVRRREERLEHDAWHPYAALFHFLTRWRDVDVEREAELAAEAAAGRPELAELDLAALLELYESPAPHFHALRDPRGTTELPLPARDGALYELLRARRTTRAFDEGRPLAQDELSTVLYYTFGCHGVARVTEHVAMLKKTSPSGGALHPVEAYALVRDVEGLGPGVYHYDVARHALALAEPLDAATARAWAREFTAGQSWFASAHVLLVLTARFWRSFWKYRAHQRAYAVLLMDAAHLSQTLYLVAAELGLGAFVTAAVNGQNIEERLGLDGYEEGVLAVCGCGVPGGDGAGLEPRFEPYLPPRG